MRCDGDEYKATFEHTFTRDGEKSFARLFEIGRFLFSVKCPCVVESCITLENEGKILHLILGTVMK